MLRDKVPLGGLPGENNFTDFAPAPDGIGGVSILMFIPGSHHV